MGLEIEFKWEANSPSAFSKIRRTVKQLGVTIHSPQRLAIEDVYLDTPHRNFEKEKIAFRVRRCNRVWEATFKTRTALSAGKAVRREETCALPRVTNLKQALAYLNQKKCWKGLTVANLEPLFVLKNRRQIQLISGKNWQAELALDTCVLHVCGRKVHFKEAELELKKGPVKLFENFARRLQDSTGLIPSRVSKVRTATSLLHLWGEK